MLAECAALVQSAAFAVDARRRRRPRGHEDHRPKSWYGFDQSFRFRCPIKGLREHSTRSSRPRSNVADAVLGGPRQVLFRQHPAENCISECSKCLFVVACRNCALIVCGATEGGIPRSPLPVIPVPGDNEGNGKSRMVRGAKGTFQGEQRPTEIDPSHDNKWRLR